jgi:hypothetical protein
VLFDLGDDTPFLVPRRRLILEIHGEPFDPSHRRQPHRPRQPMRDLLAQDVVGGQPDRMEIACFFQSPIECRDRIGGIRAIEAAPKVAVNISCDGGLQNRFPSVGAVDVAGAQGAAFAPLVHVNMHRRTAGA